MRAELLLKARLRRIDKCRNYNIFVPECLLCELERIVRHVFKTRRLAPSHVIFGGTYNALINYAGYTVSDVVLSRLNLQNIDISIQNKRVIVRVFRKGQSRHATVPCGFIGSSNVLPELDYIIDLVSKHG